MSLRSCRELKPKALRVCWRWRKCGKKPALGRSAQVPPGTIIGTFDERGPVFPRVVDISEQRALRAMPWKYRAWTQRP